MNLTNYFQISGVLSKNKSTRLVVEQSEYCVAGVLTKCDGGISSVHIARIILLLIEWRQGNLEHGGSPATTKTWVMLKDGMRTVPGWLTAIFGSKERLMQMVSLEASVAKIGVTFDRDSVQIDLRDENGTAISEPEARRVLWNWIGGRTGDITPDAANRAIQIAREDLRLSPVAKPQQLLVGKTVWLNGLMRLEAHLRHLLSKDGLLGFLIDELPKCETVGASRDMIIEWNALVNDFTRSISSEFEQFYRETDFTAEPVAKELRKILKVTVSFIQSSSPPTREDGSERIAAAPSEAIHFDDLEAILDVVKSARSQIDRQRAGLAEVVDHCRDQLVAVLDLS